MERIVSANGIDMWTDVLGDEQATSTVLLMMGTSGQGIAWEDEFCAHFTQAGHKVIRYDYRDTGLSTCVDPVESPYTVDDLAADAVGVLDALGVDAAHLVGMSLGGIVGQLVALDHPSRARTLTCITTTPSGAEAAGSVVDGVDPGSGLPPPTEAFIAAAMEVFATPPTTRDEIIDAQVRMAKAAAGTGPFDEARVRRVTTAMFDRAVNPSAAENHVGVVARAPSRLARLPEVTCPTLVFHGTADPVFPQAHGEALAAAVPDARLLLVPGMGHELPTWAWPEAIPAILEHLR